MCLCPHLGLQGKARSGVGAQGEGEMPASPVPTSLDVVHMNELVGFGEALVPESEQQAGESAFVLLLTGAGTELSLGSWLKGGRRRGHWPPRRGPGDRGLEAGHRAEATALRPFRNPAARGIPSVGPHHQGLLCFPN